MRTIAVLFSFILILAACSPENQEAKNNPEVKQAPQTSNAEAKIEQEQAQEPPQKPEAVQQEQDQQPAGQTQESVSKPEVVETPTPVATAGPVAKAYVVGTDYDVLEEPVGTITPGKIEVTEVFWYGCGHCFSFEPILNAWSENLASDVELVKSPAIWRPNMEVHARMFYTAKSLGILAKAHSKIFEAMHHKRMPMATQEEIREFFNTEFGIAPDKFDSVYTSFAVDSQVQQAGARARSFMITGTPEIIVDGRFRVTAKKAGGQEQMLEVTDYLTKQIRDKNI